MVPILMSLQKLGFRAQHFTMPQEKGIMIVSGKAIKGWYGNKFIINIFLSQQKGDLI